PSERLRHRRLRAWTDARPQSGRGGCCRRGGDRGTSRTHVLHVDSVGRVHMARDRERRTHRRAAEGQWSRVPFGNIPVLRERARALVWGVLGVTPYVDRIMELLEAASRGDPETRALVIERDATVVTLALFGPQPGTRDTWRLHGVLLAPHVDSQDLGGAMIDAVVRD